MSEGGRPRVFTIPPHADFLAVLAKALDAGWLFPAKEKKAGDGLPPFSGWRVYLPTRRAARALAGAMLDGQGEEAGVRLLPRILPLAEVGEDELFFAEAVGLGSPERALQLPQAIAGLPRLFLLARLMEEWAAREAAGKWRLARHIRLHAGAALRLARSLARLIDSFELEEKPLTAIERELAQTWPIPPERPEHREAAQDCLRYLAERYPQALEARGLIGPAARQARLIRLEAERLAAEPPSLPVIAAGSTGTVPATAHLLATVARLAKGCVVLPGLDLGMDEESWRKLEPGHPQFGMKRLLETMGLRREEVALLSERGPLPPQEAKAALTAREFLLSEAMRPAATSERWHECLGQARKRLHEGVRGLHWLLAPTRQREALAIALLMRETLETPGCRCMFVTPDRMLARAVRAELARWKVQVDDSAGQPLIDTVPGAFLKLLLEAALNGFAPQYLAALLAHPLACFGLERGRCRRAGEDLQLAVLRPLTRFDGIRMLPAYVRARMEQLQAPEAAWREHPNVRHLSKDRWQALLHLAEQVASRLLALAETFASASPQPLSGLLKQLLETAENIAAEPAAGESLLWRGEAGEALALAFSDLFAHADAAPSMSPAEFAAFLVSELAARPIRPRQPSHARLAILGPLEARLLSAERIILGGLNEGVWPPLAQTDPWLTRADMDALGLPLPERRIGLSAHDFCQLAAQREVWLTSAERIDQQPAEPSRWLLRLQAVVQDDALLIDGSEVLFWASHLDDSLQLPAPQPPPRPVPPPALRPRRISASRAKTLLRDPYAFFARHVLRLQAVGALRAAPTPALFGMVVHAALEEFARRWPAGDWPADAEDRLFALLREKHAEIIGNEEHLRQVKGRLARLAAWFVRACEEKWRKDARAIIVETEGRMTLNEGDLSFVLTARADRIDLLADGGVRLIDYKTGTLPGRRGANYDPQMDLEAAMAMHGAFDALDGGRAVREMLLVKVSGGEEAGKVQDWNRPGRNDKRAGEKRAAEALGGLGRLLAAYADPARAYLPPAGGENAWRDADYEHLSRWREWIALLTTEAES